MFANNNKLPQAMFDYNRLMVTNIGMKLSTHPTSSPSNTNGFHGNNQQQSASGSFYKMTYSLLKLPNHTMHGAETWYVCVFERFHDNH